MNDGGAVGSVLRIERTSIHDGQGLRTVIFLKGCPLSCRWCSTPESQRSTPQKGYARDRCLGCGRCVCSCPEGALLRAEEGRKVLTDASKCKNCFVCVAKCLQGAQIRYGRLMFVRDVIREIVKDEIFFFHSGGGVTISGGEPLSQSDFVAEVLRECRELGIHTAMETSLHAPYESIEKVLPWLNVLYVDLKHMDQELHKQWVGQDNTLILDNLRKLDQANDSLEIIVRLPLVPGANDSSTNLSAVAQFCRSLQKIKEIELLPYHRLGLETYRNLERDYLLKELLPPSQEQLSEWAEFLGLQNPGVPIRVEGAIVGKTTVSTT